MPRAPFTRPIPPHASGRPLVLGHRGASASAPENTLGSFRLAVEQGADGVELDVWRCGTGEPVVIHDADTRRTAGVSLSVRRAPLQALKALDVGSWKGSAWRGERIPTLREVLDALPGAVVNVELKSSPGVPDLRLARGVADVIDACRAADRVVVSSFDPVLLALFHLVAPPVATGALFAADQRWKERELVGRALGAVAVHPEWQLVDAARMAAWRDAGLAVNVWTVDALDDLLQACNLGVTAVISNRPDVACEAVRRHRGR